MKNDVIGKIWTENPPCPHLGELISSRKWASRFISSSVMLLSFPLVQSPSSSKFNYPLLKLSKNSPLCFNPQTSLFYLSRLISPGSTLVLSACFSQNLSQLSRSTLLSRSSLSLFFLKISLTASSESSCQPPLSLPRRHHLHLAASLL